MSCLSSTLSYSTHTMLETNSAGLLNKPCHGLHVMSFNFDFYKPFLSHVWSLYIFFEFLGFLGLFFSILLHYLFMQSKCDLLFPFLFSFCSSLFQMTTCSLYIIMPSYSHLTLEHNKGMYQVWVVLLYYFIIFPSDSFTMEADHTVSKLR